MNQDSLSLRSPISVLKGVGSRIEEKFHKLNIRTVQDALFHLPVRYIDRTRIRSIAELESGMQAFIQGTIESSQIKYGAKRSLLCLMNDGTGLIALRFFNFSRAQKNTLIADSEIRCYGTVRQGTYGLEIAHPEYSFVKLSRDRMEPKLVPVYPTTQGLRQSKLTSIITQALSVLTQSREIEFLPPPILNRFSIITLSATLKYIHCPPVDADIAALQDRTHPTQRRLAMEELLAHYLSLKLARKSYRKHHAPLCPVEEGGLLSKFREQLPFSLTQAQQVVYEAIRKDIASEVPMLRLLQGDVGSGKTVVAALAALQVINHGYKVALMAPTELLTEQHSNTLKAWLLPLSVPVMMLSGKMKKKSYEACLARFLEPEPILIVGTHALFQSRVEFAKLGLVIIDEQHRFGVEQRLALWNKGRFGSLCPHQLAMTATPIPRTLTMVGYADLDVSVIDEMPPHRVPISTSVVSNKRRKEIIERIDKACQQSRQAYWICTLIEESESLSCEAAVSTWEALKQELPSLSIGLVHGKMQGEEKELEIEKFRTSETNVLVATTVVEVGVDIPSASLMIIDNAERLGLAQLHQLRGRIGRGKIKSDCVLLCPPGLSGIARERIDAMRNLSNGFEIAELDLSLRGPGELLGKRQAGLPDMKIADLVRDREVLNILPELAAIMLEQYKKETRALISRWIGMSIENRNA